MSIIIGTLTITVFFVIINAYVEYITVLPGISAALTESMFVFLRFLWLAKLDLLMN